MLCATYPLFSPLIFLLFILVEYSPPCSQFQYPTLHNTQAQQSQTVSIPIASHPLSLFPFLGPLLKYDPYLCRAKPLFHTFFASYLVPPPIERWATSSPPSPNFFLSYLLYAKQRRRHDYFHDRSIQYYPRPHTQSFLAFISRFSFFSCRLYFSPFLFPQIASSIALVVVVKVVYYVHYSGLFLVI